jgi:hypothetical protein
MFDQQEYIRFSRHEQNLESKAERKAMCEIRGKNCKTCDGKTEYGDICPVLKKENE